MIRTRPRKTVKDYMALPTENGVELIQGEFVMSPSPQADHQKIVVALCVALKTQICGGELLVSPMDVILADDTVVQPDLLYVGPDRLAIIKERVAGAPDLVIEILSPSTRDRDRLVRTGLYARFGVREYWLVDPDTRTIQVLTLEGSRYKVLAIFEERDRLSTPVFPELKLDLSVVWR
jgi:Uma2 family endonuclease